MAIKLILLSSATQDLTESIDWYNKVQSGLGLKFYREVKTLLEIIQKNPTAFPQRYKFYHTALLRKFPFMIHYAVNEEKSEIVIISVLHTSRDPKIWDERSK